MDHAQVAGELKDGTHHLYARIYYADTDFSGFVYHGRYLEFYERGRTDFLRLQDVHHIELAEGSLGEEMVWVVRRMEIDYKSPAKMDDLILIETRVSEIRGARVIMAQKITCGVQQGFLQRTPRGRVLTALAWQHMGLTAPTEVTQQSQFGLFTEDE